MIEKTSGVTFISICTHVHVHVNVVIV